MDRVPPIQDCDAVACRNVLLYLTPAAIAHAQDVVERALAPGGILLLGPTDRLVRPERFETRWTSHGVIHSLAARP